MRDVLYVAIILGLLPLIVFRPWWGILAWTVFGLVNPQEYTYYAQTFRFALLLGGATLLGLLLTKERKPVPLSAPTVLIALLALWVTVTTLWAWAPAPAWEQWEKVVKILFMALATTMLVYGRKRVMVLLVTLMVALGFFGVKGGIFTIVTGGQHRVNGPGEHGYISGNSGIGVALLMILPLVMVMAQEQKRRWVRLSIWASFWLMAIATIFTYSRGALLGLGAVMLCLLLKAKRKAMVFLLVIPAIIFAYGYVPEKLIDRAETIQTYEEDGSAMARIQSWGVAWNVATSNPLGAGFGFDALSDRWLSYAFFRDDGNFSHSRTAHSIYFQMLGEHGFVGLFLFLALVAATLRTLGRVRKLTALADKNAPNFADYYWLGRFAEAMQIGIVGYVVAGAFFNLAYFDLYYLYVAIAVIMLRDCRELSRGPTEARAPVVAGSHAWS